MTTLLSRSLIRTLVPSTAHVHRRAFHSPFVSLTPNAPLTSTRHTATGTATACYEKQADNSPEPQRSHSGTQTYVVSPPDLANVPYSVPSGAYPVDAPYPASLISRHANHGSDEQA